MSTHKSPTITWNPIAGVHATGPVLSNTGVFVRTVLEDRVEAIEKLLGVTHFTASDLESQPMKDLKTMQDSILDEANRTSPTFRALKEIQSSYAILKALS